MMKSKQMKEENLLKMAAYAVPILTDVQTANILLCYLLYRIDRPLSESLLYDIAVGTEIISYFTYQESLDYLQSHQFITVSEQGYSLTQEGIAAAREVHNCVAKPYRERIVEAATRRIALSKWENAVKLDYIPLERGYYVRIRMLDLGHDMLDMKIYAPDMIQAKYLGEQIMLDPVRVYNEMLTAAFENQPEPIQLRDMIE